MLRKYAGIAELSRFNLKLLIGSFQQDYVNSANFARSRIPIFIGMLHYIRYRTGAETALSIICSIT